MISYLTQIKRAFISAFKNRVFSLNVHKKEDNYPVFLSVFIILYNSVFFGILFTN